MKFTVLAKTRARETKVTRIDEDKFRVAVTAAPERGRANAAIIQALASHFKVAPSRISIIIGKTSREKLIEII